MSRLDLAFPTHVYGSGAIPLAEVARCIANGVKLISTGANGVEVGGHDAALVAGGIRLAFYEKGDAGGNGFPEGWYAHDLTVGPTQRVGPNAYHLYSMQIDATGPVQSNFHGWKDQHSAAILSDAIGLGPHWTVCFHDSMGALFSSSARITLPNGTKKTVRACDPATGLPYALPAWAAIVWPIMPATHAKLVASGPATSYQHCANGIEQNTKAQWGLCDIGMQENWPYPNQSTPGGYASWLSSMTDSMQAMAAGVELWVYSKMPNGSTRAQVNRMRSIVVASAHIVRNPGDKMLVCTGPSEGGPMPWDATGAWSYEYMQPEYALDLGSPLETFATPQGYIKVWGTSNHAANGPGGLAARRYSNGYAIANLYTGSLRFALPNGITYTDAAGNSYSGTITVPAQTGLTLVTGSGPATGKPVVTGGSATGVGQHVATTDATVNPTGLATQVWVDLGVGTDASGNPIYTMLQPVPAVDIGNGFADVAVSIDLSGLNASTLYYARFTATNSAGPVHGTGFTFTTSAVPITAPSVGGTTADTIGTTSAQTHANINPNGNGTTYYVEYGKTTSYGQQAPASPGDAGSGSAAVAVTVPLGALEPNTLYHYRFVATNGGGTVRGADHTFTTLKTTPVVSILAARNITGTGATMRAQVTSENDATTYHFEYGSEVDAAGAPTYPHTLPVPDASIAAGMTPQTVTQALTGLSPNTAYYYRVRAANSAGGTLVSGGTFTTGALLARPTVTGETATLVTHAGATLEAQVNPNGLQTTYHWEHGPTSSYGTSTQPTAAGAGSTPVSVGTAIAGYAPGTLVHYRIVATNSKGTTNGADATFTTTPDTQAPDLTVTVS